MAKRVRLVSTAYGPPWGGIQGTGVTATGVDLRKNPRQYVVAVDPKIIPLGSRLKIPDNPFGDPNIVFTAADTGGAIKGNRLDFFDWRGRKTQMNWGTRPITASIVGSGNPKRPARAGTPGTPAVPGAPAIPGTGPTLAPGTSPSAFSDGTGLDLAALIRQLMAPARGGGGGGMGLAAPSFAAGPNLPAGYQSPVSGGGPAPKTDVGSVIQQIMPAIAQLGMPASRKPGLLIPGIPRTPGVPGIPGTPGTPGTPGSAGGASGGRRGRISVAPGANRSGVGLSGTLTHFVSLVAGRAREPITITTGTNHNRLTVNGNVSDHWDGHGADIAVPVDSARGDHIASAALQAAGVPKTRAMHMARSGGLYNVNYRGHRVQVIWRTNEGGNHHNHVHIGIR